jgi:hypothetical protein
MHGVVSPVPHSWRHRDEQVTDLGRLLVGLVVVTVGALFLLDAADALDAGAAIAGWWPVVFVVAGLFTLLERPPARVRGVLLAVAGAVGLLFTTDVLDPSAWKYVWPVAVIAAGVAVIARWRGGRVAPGLPEDTLRATAVFGGSELHSTAAEFRGAWVTAVFGGVTLDLREATPAVGGASVNTTAAFGGVEILVPRGWRIAVRSVPIFGGVEDKTDHTVMPAPDAPVLRVDAVSLFGGVEIKHGK